MNTEEFIKELDPVMKMAVESEIWVKTLARHYKKTISKMSGKSEEDIQHEIEDIFAKVKEETIEKLKNNGKN